MAAAKYLAFVAKSLVLPPGKLVLFQVHQSCWASDQMMSQLGMTSFDKSQVHKTLLMPSEKHETTLALSFL